MSCEVEDAIEEIKRELKEAETKDKIKEILEALYDMETQLNEWLGEIEDLIKEAEAKAKGVE